jgi:hypothetical protein
VHRFSHRLSIRVDWRVFPFSISSVPPACGCLIYQLTRAPLALFYLLYLLMFNSSVVGGWDDRVLDVVGKDSDPLAREGA